MGRIRQVSRSTIPAGSTRTVDATLDPSDLATLNNLRFKSGVLRSVGVNGSCTWDFQKGRQCVKVPSGLGNGWLPQFPLPISTVRPANTGALVMRSGITRLYVSMLTGDLSGVNNANSDIGFDMLVGVPSGISDLRTANNSHLVGSSGVGVLLMLSGQWAFWNKHADTPAGTVAEATPFPAAQQAALNSGEYTDLEFRIYDATPASEAKLELYINQAKILTRYWTNPAGVTDALLPPLGLPAAGVTGTGVIPQIRNTSTGPPAMYFADLTVVQGPNDAGTL